MSRRPRIATSDVIYVFLTSLPNLANDIGLPREAVTMRMNDDNTIRVHAGNKQADLCPHDLINLESRLNATKVLKEALKPDA